MSKTILVIAAHPDDELLGAGGTLIKHVKSGDRVHALILGQGVMSRKSKNEDDRATLLKQAAAAHAVVGFSKVEFADFPDNEYDTVSLLKITQRIEETLASVKPDVVYTHHSNDLNIDHRLVFEAVLTASRPCNENAPAILYTFETLSSTEWLNKAGNQFAPNTYVNISDTLELKQKALACYKSEMRPYPHSRSLEGVRILAEYRGLESGNIFCEAFTLIRSIQK